ncbi:hypothetical protein GIB67_019793, partial [Kingdonia uniflora]
RERIDFKDIVHCYWSRAWELIVEVAVSSRYTMNEKVPPTASNRRKIELAREGDLVTYKRKRKIIDPSTVILPNTVDTANEGGLEFETESAQAALRAQPSLTNVSPNSDVNIHIIGGYSKGEGATRNNDVFENSLLQDLNRFKSLKAGGAGNSLSLGKLKGHYAYKLEKVLSDGTTAATKKKKGLTTSRRYLHISQSLLGSPRRWTLTHTSTVLVGNVTYLLRIDTMWNEFILKKADRERREREGPLVYDDVGIHQRKEAIVNEHGDTPVYQSEDVAEQYDASTSECDLLKETIEQMKEDIELKRVVDEKCVLKFTDLPRQLDVKILECKNLKEKNTSLEAELRLKSGLEDCNQSLSVELNKKLIVQQSHQPVPDVTLAKKYEDLLAVHEDVKKKLIGKNNFQQKLVNAEEMMTSLEANNTEWEVWRQALKKAFASEGMKDMEDPTFEELFGQNERFFTIA